MTITITRCTRKRNNITAVELLTSFGTFLVHNTVATLSATNRISWFDLVLSVTFWPGEDAERTELVSVVKHPTIGLAFVDDHQSG